MTARPKTIYCPQCGRRVATWDGKSTIPVIVNCSHCKKRVVYNMDTDETLIKPLPPVDGSGSKTFH